MNIDRSTKINALLNEYPFLIEFLPTVAPEFKKLTNPLMRKTMGRIATIEKAAGIGGLKPEVLLEKINNEIKKKSKDGAPPKVAKEVVEDVDEKDARKEVLKDIIKDLHKGEDMEVLKKRFSVLLEDVEPSEIAQMEQSLIEEGMPESEVKKLCDVHVQVFKHSLDEKEVPDVPPGHPVHTFMKENRATEDIIKELETVIGKMGEAVDEEVLKKGKDEFTLLLNKLSEIDNLRKENQLFPLLESKGISGPTSVMWEIHDDIREQLKRSKEMVDQNKMKEAHLSAEMMVQMIKDMIYKEENILYPMSLENLGDEDWIKVRKGEEEIGYSWIEPEEGWSPGLEDVKEDDHATGEAIDGVSRLSLDTGALTLEIINLMLKHLPVDLSFVDVNDEVAYYSDAKERIFPRSPGVIGRKVQKCHPPSSVHVVQNIVDEFKAGNKDVAEFWIQLQGRFLHIRYFAVRDEGGKYRGTLEVSQDVTEIKKLEGQRRLLDWK